MSDLGIQVGRISHGTGGVDGPRNEGNVQPSQPGGGSSGWLSSIGTGVGSLLSYTRESIVGGLSSGKDKLVDGGTYVKDSLVGGGTYVKDSLVSGGTYVKDSLVSGGSYVKDTTVEKLSQAKGYAMPKLEYGLGTTIKVALSDVPELLNLVNVGEHIEGTAFRDALPNVPDFERAKTDKSQECSGLYQRTLDSEGTDGRVKDVLRHLDGSINGTLTRGGEGTQLTTEQFRAVLLCGGHFVRHDGGELFNQLRTDGGDQFVERSSSHYKDSPHGQYGMDLPNHMGHLLIGRTRDGDTFFQFESHGTGGGAQSLGEKVGDFVGHTKAYLMHIGTSEHYVQIGPQGCIAASEKDGMHVVIDPA